MVTPSVVCREYQEVLIVFCGAGSRIIMKLLFPPSAGLLYCNKPCSNRVIVVTRLKNKNAYLKFNLFTYKIERVKLL